LSLPNYFHIFCLFFSLVLQQLLFLPSFFSLLFALVFLLLLFQPCLSPFGIFLLLLDSLEFFLPADLFLFLRLQKGVLAVDDGLVHELVVVFEGVEELE